MPVSISTFKYSAFLLLFLGGSFGTSLAMAQNDPSGRTLQPEEDDYSESAFTRYGDFSNEEEEAEELRFLQFGRLFGVSLGAGFEGATGNRGGLWQGGAPSIDFKIHYWFDFNFALDLALYTAPHYYEITAPADDADRFEVRLVRLGIDLKYYFETKDLSSAFSFSNPYVSLGVGSYTKTETSLNTAAGADEESAFGLNVGAGLEFPLKPKKAYFNLEGRLHSVTFKDTRTGRFLSTKPELPDLTGMFYTLSASILFTW